MLSCMFFYPAFSSARHTPHGRASWVGAARLALCLWAVAAARRRRGGVLGLVQVRETGSLTSQLARINQSGGDESVRPGPRQKAKLRA